MFKSESITKLAAALVKAQSQMGNAVKDNKNPFFKSTYADLNSVREACLPSLNANGISVLQPTVHADGKNLVETILLHESGEWVSGFTEIVVAKQNDPQATGSGISYARRYGLQSMLNISSVDDDGESAMNRQPKQQVTQTAPAATPTLNSVVTAKPAAVEVQATPAPTTSNGAAKRSSFRKVTAAPAATADDGWDA